jgi:uncharacterized membrane protein affecting hemolysin expression
MKISFDNRGAAVERLVVILSAVAMCIIAITFTLAQSTSSQALPATVCKAITTYIAKVDAARSISEKAKREKQYAEARDGLSAVLDQYGQATLLTEASSYAQYTEIIATADPGKPGLADDLDKRLKSRSALLERCSDYTSSR